MPRRTARSLARPIALLIGCALALVAAEADAPLLTDGEGAAVDAALEQAIALGFPEVRGGAWHRSASQAEFFDLRLAAGGWLLGGWLPRAEPWRQQPETDAAGLAGAHTVPADALAWDLLRLAPADLRRLQRAAGFSCNGVISDRLPGWHSPLAPDLALPGAVLRRGGAAALGDRLLVQAQYQRTRAEARLCFPDDDPARFAGYETPAQAWDERLEHTLWLVYERCDRWRASEHAASARLGATLSLLPLATVLRRELSQWFRQRLVAAEGEAEARRWQAAMLAIVDDGDRAAIAADAALLLARALVPTTPAADEPLARRLAAWDEGPFSRSEHQPLSGFDRLAELAPNEVAARLADGDARGRRELAHWTLFRGCAADADGLVALLGSEAPCRWLEQDTPRLLGDNALRALTCAWGVDPRVLAGRDRFAPWTAAERAATAAAIRAWWERCPRPPSTAFIARAAELPPWSVRRLWHHGDDGERQRLLAVLGAAWRAGPPPTRDRQEENDLRDLLEDGLHDRQLATLLLPWPIAGPYADVLLQAHETAGEHAPLDGLLARALDGAPTAADRDLDRLFPLSSAFAVALRDETPARLRLALRALAGDAASAPMRGALAAVLQGGHDADGIRLLRWSCLSDRRTLAEDIASDLLRGTGYDVTAGNQAGELRVCDLLLAVLRGPAPDGAAEGIELSTLLRAPLAERDAALAGRRAALLKPTQDLATGLGLPPGDWDALRLPQVKSDF